MPGKQTGPAVFVRGLPYKYSNEALATLFSNVAPVKHAFVIMDIKTKESKGYGFVQFTLDEDSVAAKEKMDKTTVEGRVISVEIAKPAGTHEQPERGRKTKAAFLPAPVADAPSKVHDEAGALDSELPRVSGGKRKRPEAKKEEAPPEGESEDEPRSAPAPSDRPSHRPGPAFGPALEQQQRHLGIFGIPPDFPFKRLWKRVKKSGAKAMVWPSVLPGSCKTTAAVVEYEKKITRDRALKKLEGHALLGNTFVVRPGEDVLPPRMAHTKSRLIVRNLPFSATASDVLASMPGGAIKSLVTHVHLPQKAGPTGEGDREQAIELINGKKVRGREVAVDWAVPQATFQEMKDSVPEESPAAGEKPLEAALGAVTASPSAPGRDKSDLEDGSGSGGDDIAEDGKVSSGGEESSEGDEGQIAEHDDPSGSSSESGSESSKKIDGKEAATASRPKEEPGALLFVRNLPFDCDDNALFDAFKSFGPLHYARVVHDKETGRSKGTGFVQFYTKEAADNALEAGGSVDAKTRDNSAAVSGKEAIRTAKKRAAEAAVNAALLSGGVKVSGRTVVISRAMTKDEAAAQSASKESAQKRFDKRHLYLQYEGTITAESASATHMPKSDLLKRQAAATDKKTKLKSPLFFVSPVRLSIRNLAKGVDDKALRRLAKEAAKAGMDAGLVIADEGDPSLRPKAGTRPKISVIKAKVIRESVGNTVREGKAASTRLDTSGKAMSRGYGFVEFSEHIHALAALRQLNNNPAHSAEYAAGGAAARAKPVDDRPRLIVEFTVEDWRQVKKQAKKQDERKRVREANIEGGYGVVSSKMSDAGLSHLSPANPNAKPKLPTAKPVRKVKQQGIAAPSRVPGQQLSGSKRRRPTPEPLTEDPGIAAILGSAPATSDRPAKVRRLSKKKEQAEEAAHDKMVASYKARLFGNQAGGKSEGVNLAKWM